VEQTSDWVLIAGTDGRIHYVNRTVERLTGYRREELIGQTPRIFKSGKHTRAFYRRLLSGSNNNPPQGQGRQGYRIRCNGKGYNGAERASGEA